MAPRKVSSTQEASMDFDANSFYNPIKKFTNFQWAEAGNVFPMSPPEQFVMPLKSVLGNIMYAQFIDFLRKQVKEWNQCRKENMDVPLAPEKEEQS
ncbi:hypothetical protein J1N35_007390 [Gossypium stocksii]|uniref:Uncharacterized protein n=1 Tax=Gossypium stocksii TaxID=47602 RepID=A0A9D4ADF4_9ROSI|nr:hypothetical protein J1N35_007390 [Gossypium stocksii]